MPRRRPVPHGAADNAFLLRDTLLRMIEGEALPYAELVAGEAV